MKTMNTPWGPADGISYLNDERTIIRVHTSSHGGIGVRCDVPMPPHFPCGLDGDNWRWYEEDQEWCFPATAYPACFKPDAVQIAKDLMRNWYPDAFEAHFAEKVTSSNSAARRRDELNSRLHGNYRVKACWSDSCWNVPTGQVLALGVRASDGDEATFLVPKPDYKALDELVLDRYPRFTPDRTLPYSKPREQIPAN